MFMFMKWEKRRKQSRTASVGGEERTDRNRVGGCCWSSTTYRHLFIPTLKLCHFGQVASHMGVTYPKWISNWIQ